MDEKFLWKKTLDEIEIEVPEVAFSSFFKKTRLRISDGRAEVLCQNEGMCFVLKNKYHELINKTLEKNLEKEITVSFVPENKTNKTPGPLFATPKETTEQKLVRVGLSPKLSFESFAVSISNQIAQAAAISVATEPGTLYNPLFIWGGVGVGKTHLLHAIGRKILETTNKTVFYCSTEDFTNLLIEAIKNKNTQAFRRKLRNIDVLLMDDIQFVSERDFIQEELFHTFNKLQSLNKQIVFTSDKPPKAIRKIEDRLVSRFLSGLVVDVQQPDFELKTAILLIKAKDRGLFMDVSMAKIISANVHEFRELEGFLLKLSALKNTGSVVDVELIRKLLLVSDTGSDQKRNPKDIIRAAAKEMGIKLKELKEENRKKEVALCRHVSMYLLKTMTNLTYEDIAALLNKKDHTTVMHGVQRVIDLISTDQSTRQLVEKIKLCLN